MKAATTTHTKINAWPKRSINRTGEQVGLAGQWSTHRVVFRVCLKFIYLFIYFFLHPNKELLLLERTLTNGFGPLCLTNASSNKQASILRVKISYTDKNNSIFIQFCPRIEKYDCQCFSWIISDKVKSFGALCWDMDATVLQ